MSKRGDISKFEEWLKVRGITDYEQHVSFLRNLQELRSAGTGHRKGKEYQKIATKFQLSEDNKRSDFERILQSAIPCLRKATVITDALLARNENNKITEGGDEDE